MTTNVADNDKLDQAILKSLLQFDEALRIGELPTSPIICALNDTQIADLMLAQQCLQELESAMPRLQGRVERPVASDMPRAIGRFDIKRILGSGGFATVYLARDRLLNRLVALKIPHTRSLMTPDLRRRFIREGQAAAQLDHPHIVPTFEAGEEGELPYIAFAYCEGPTLASWLRQRNGPMVPQAAAILVRRLAAAVQYSHDRGILHRDIKPANVLLFPDHQVTDSEFPFIPRLADFGLAKVAESPTEDTASSMLLGTPLYMSPEQATGCHNQVGPWSDVYALGALLYYLLTGRPPFLAAGLIQTLLQVAEQEPVPPAELNRAIDRDLSVICQKCLEKSPSRRYPSAQDLADDLNRFLSHEPIRARRISKLARCARWCRRKPWVASSIGVFLVALTCVGTGALIHFQRTAELNYRLADSNHELTLTTQRADAERGRALANAKELRFLLYASDMALAHRALCEGDVLTCHNLLNKHSPRTGEEDIRDAAWWHLYGLAHRPPSTIARFAAPAYCVRCSADGRFVVACSADGTVQLFSTQDDRLLGKIETQQGEVNGVSFSHSGQRLATAGDDGTIRVWDRETLQEVRRLDAHQDLAYDAIFTVDDKLLISCGGDTKIRLWDVETGMKVGELAGHERPVEKIVLSRDGSKLISGSLDGTCRQWTLATRQELSKRIRPERVKAICFNHDESRIFVGTAAGEITAHAPANADETHVSDVFPSANEAVCDLALSLSSPPQLLIASRDGMIRAVNLDPEYEAGDPLFDAVKGNSWLAHEGKVYSIALSPDGKHLYSVGEDGLLKHWSFPVERQLKVRSYNDLPQFADSIVGVMPDTDRMALVSRKTGESRIWDPFKGSFEPWATFGTHAEQLAISTDEKCLAIGYSDGRVEFWDISGPHPQLRWQLPFDKAGRVTAIAVADDAERLVVAHQDTTYIRRIAADSGRELAGCSLPIAHTPGVNWIALSPDGKSFAAAYRNYVLLFSLDANQGQVLRGHRYDVRQVDFHPSGRWLVSCSGDRAMLLWDVATGTLSARFEGHRTAVFSAFFTSDGRSIVSQSADGHVKLWHMETRKQMFDLLELPTAWHEVLQTSGRVVLGRDRSRLFALPVPVKD